MYPPSVERIRKSFWSRISFSLAPTTTEQPALTLSDINRLRTAGFAVAPASPAMSSQVLWCKNSSTVLQLKKIKQLGKQKSQQINQPANSSTSPTFNLRVERKKETNTRKLHRLQGTIVGVCLSWISMYKGQKNVYFMNSPVHCYVLYL